ncbi:hypothetical protein [Actinoplanes sp. NPDC023714]|uniref:hypothetical protein n=1 Tax=Actinoplanes sp. NPDC023714 TaxID=3154322 RepID=UPI0033E96C97
MQWFLWAAGIAAVTVVLFLLILRHLRRPARPLTREERLAAARAAGKGLRRSGPRDRDPNADTRWSLYDDGNSLGGGGGGGGNY